MQVPFAKDSFTSEIPINWYPAADTDKGVILMGAPGLRSVIALSAASYVRGMRVAGDYLYVVCGTTVYRVDSSFSANVLGSIGTDTGKVWIEYNGVQVGFVDGVSLYVYTIATAVFAKVTDADFPGAVSFTYQDGYGAFIAPKSGQFWLTNLYDFTAITGTDYASAEGWPDNLNAIIMNYREFWLFGLDTTEIWYNSGGTFPFTRIQGGLIEQGCAAAASVAKADNMVYWLASTRQVMGGKGYQPQILSTRRIEREIDNMTTVSDAVGWTQVFEGHTFYWLTFPTEKVTLVYDAATQQWHKRTSYPDYDRHRANCYAYFAGKHIVGDYLNGRLYEMRRDIYSDNGQELIAVVDSPEIRDEKGKRQFFPGLEVVFNQGLVDMTAQPTATLSWSNDHGKTWSNELQATMGDIGEYGVRTTFRRLGSGYNRIFRLKVSDAVSRDILAVNWT